MKNGKCPYCGKKVSYFSIFFEKNKGEHKCSNCRRNSTIFFVKAYNAAIILTIIAAIVITVLSIIFNINSLWNILYVFIPFLILYLVTPFFYRLVPIKGRYKTSYSDKSYNQSKKDYNKEDYKITENYDKTRMIPKVDANIGDEEFTDISKLL